MHKHMSGPHSWNMSPNMDYVFMVVFPRHVHTHSRDVEGLERSLFQRRSRAKARGVSGPCLPCACLPRVLPRVPATLTQCFCLIRQGKLPHLGESTVGQQGWGSLALFPGFQAALLGRFRVFPAGPSPDLTSSSWEAADSPGSGMAYTRCDRSGLRATHGQRSESSVTSELLLPTALPQFLERQQS